MMSDVDDEADEWSAQLWPYVQAEQAGQRGQDCDTLYDQCTFRFFESFHV